MQKRGSVAPRLPKGVSDDGRIHGMTREQMEALDSLLVEVSTDTIEPALRIAVHHRELDDRAFVLVEVPRGDAVHERSGRAFIRVGEPSAALAAITGVNLYQIHRFEVVGFRDVFSAVTIQGLRLSFGSFYLL